MNASILERAEAPKTNEDKGVADAWNDCRTWMAAKPEAATKCGDNKALGIPELQFKPEVQPTKETPEIKAAYAQLLERTKGLDPKAVADGIAFSGDLAASGLKLPGLTPSDNSKLEPNTKLDPNDIAHPAVSDAYHTLLQRGFNPVLIVDALTVAGDVAQIAMSPQGRKLVEDIKTLISHVRG